MKHLQQADKQGVTLRDLLFAKKEAQNEALLKTCLQSLLNAALQPASEKGYTLLSIDLPAKQPKEKCNGYFIVHR